MLKIEEDCALHQPDHRNWSTKTQALLTRIGEAESWTLTAMNPINMKKARTELLRLEEERWRAALKAKPKLRTYLKLKGPQPDFGRLSKYLKANLPKNQRSLLTNLRIGTLPIELEVGCYTGTPAEDRTCKICATGAVEDEIHLIASCPEYAEIREQFREKLGWQDASTGLEKLQSLEDHPYVGGKFLEALWYKRKRVVAANKPV